MLHCYAVTNFLSFRERTEVNWVLDAKVPTSAWSGMAPTGQRVSTVMAVIGPNASGKTSLLKAITFLDWFVRHSFHAEAARPMPVQAHFSLNNEPSEFEADLDWDDKQWRYVLRCTPERVLHEALYVKRERMNYVFVRDWNEESQDYSVKQKDFGLASQEARKVRQNASLISTAAQYGVPLALKMTEDYVWSNLRQFGRVNPSVDEILRAADYFQTNAPQKIDMSRLICSWDLGLRDIHIEARELTSADGKKETYWFPMGVHSLRDGGEMQVGLGLESSGTQSAFVLLSRLLPALENGGLAVIDEFENDLHPHMLEPILDLFANPQTNPRQAQLLFTCHAMEVLNILHKSQVTLVEKNANNESAAWRLDSVKNIRSDDNFYAKYMAGAYGAVPQL